MINLKNKHTDDVNKLNLEHFSKIKDLQKKIDTTENDLKDKLIDKQAHKGLISTKEFNEKLKQKASITEFNLKKEFELKFKEQLESHEREMEQSKSKIEKMLESKLKKQVQECEKRMTTD